MQLGKTETLCVLNEDDRGIWDIDPHFNDSGGHKDICFMRENVSMTRALSAAFMRPVIDRIRIVSEGRRGVFLYNP